MARPRLKKGDISIAEVLAVSKDYYKRYDYERYDDKRKRAKLDVISAVMKKRNNYEYDRSKRQWVQTGREVLFIFNVRTRPISYKKIDTIKIHQYPVYFLLRDVSMGMNSAFRWREGSFAKPTISPKGATKEQRVRIANLNIRKKVQMQFFFDNEAILDLYGLLYGPNVTNKKLPMKRNKELTPFFGKHAYAVLIKRLAPILIKENKKPKEEQ